MILRRRGGKNTPDQWKYLVYQSSKEKQTVNFITLIRKCGAFFTERNGMFTLVFIKPTNKSEGFRYLQCTDDYKSTQKIFI